MHYKRNKMDRDLPAADIMVFHLSLLSFFLYQLSALGLISKSLACSRAIRWGQTSVSVMEQRWGEADQMYPDSMVISMPETPGSSAGAALASLTVERLSLSTKKFISGDQWPAVWRHPTPAHQCPHIFLARRQRYVQARLLAAVWSWWAAASDRLQEAPADPGVLHAPHCLSPHLAPHSQLELRSVCTCRRSM